MEVEKIKEEEEEDNYVEDHWMEEDEEEKKKEEVKASEEFISEAQGFTEQVCAGQGRKMKDESSSALFYTVSLKQHKHSRQKHVGLKSLCSAVREMNRARLFFSEQCQLN